MYNNIKAMKILKEKKDPQNLRITRMAAQYNDPTLSVQVYFI
jgi:hypothetical protein